jgi:hypothetical protein
MFLFYYLSNCSQAANDFSTAAGGAVSILDLLSSILGCGFAAL